VCIGLSEVLLRQAVAAGWVAHHQQSFTNRVNAAAASNSLHVDQQQASHGQKSTKSLLTSSLIYIF